MTKLLIKIIGFYQRTISPDHSSLGKSLHPYGYCRFYPTCSEYAKEVLETKGILGGGKIALRILRCNPFSAPGIDPIIKNT